MSPISAAAIGAHQGRAGLTPRPPNPQTAPSTDAASEEKADRLSRPVGTRGLAMVCVSPVSPPSPHWPHARLQVFTPPLIVPNSPVSPPWPQTASLKRRQNQKERENPSRH